ncbi:OmpA family protein [Allosphingosinicella sp.]|uniref:OmpA family protein n=1 Tax=Allosphingosinicella sp. TaxID=2823234 RepID=UPI0037844276
MNRLPLPRWAVSFADLLLLLLGCFVLLNAMQAQRSVAAAPMAASAPAEAPVRSFHASEVFQPGEALLTPEAREALRAEGARLAGHAIRILSTGTGEDGGRLDRFELAAARAAAVGRALREGGLGEGQIAIAMGESGTPGAGQAIAISRR